MLFICCCAFIQDHQLRDYFLFISVVRKNSLNWILRKLFTFKRFLRSSSPSSEWMILLGFVPNCDCIFVRDVIEYSRETTTNGRTLGHTTEQTKKQTVASTNTAVYNWTTASATSAAATTRDCAACIWRFHTYWTLALAFVCLAFGFSSFPIFYCVCVSVVSHSEWLGSFGRLQ